MKAIFADGVADVHDTRDYEALRSSLEGTLERLWSVHEGQARRLAIEGFEATLAGVEARIDFVENDSGNVAAATLDSQRADAGFSRGARLLRAAARLLGVRVVGLNGY